jgi:hypothetical protein
MSRSRKGRECTLSKACIRRITATESASSVMFWMAGFNCKQCAPHCAGHEQNLGIHLRHHGAGIWQRLE